MAEGVVVVEHRMDDRDLALRVGVREAEIVDACARRNSCGRRCRRDRAARCLRWRRFWNGSLRACSATGAGCSPERRSCRRAAMPSQPQTHLSLSANCPRFPGCRGSRDSPASSSRRCAEIVLVELIDAGGADRVGAVDQALAEFALQQRALLGRDHRREGRVVVRRQRPVVRHLDADAVDRARSRSIGIRKPVLRLTVGSGAEKYGS